MDQGIIMQGFVPMRSNPDERSEMVSQVLFGESFNVLDYYGDWVSIENTYDGYKGWITKGAMTEISSRTDPDEPENIVINQSAIVVRKKTNHRVILPAGSVTGKIVKGEFRLNGELFHLEDPDIHFTAPDPTNEIETIARAMVSIPYLWGGRCGFGFDCSGLSQFIGRVLGHKLPRDSQQQALEGQNVNFIHEIEPGDLAFFDNAEGEIVHVGVILGGNRILHSSGYVRIDRLDQQGIYNVEKGRYTHRLRVIKRMS